VLLTNSLGSTSFPLKCPALPLVSEEDKALSF